MASVVPQMRCTALTSLHYYFNVSLAVIFASCLLSEIIQPCHNLDLQYTANTSSTHWVIRYSFVDGYNQMFKYKNNGPPSFLILSSRVLIGRLTRILLMILFLLVTRSAALPRNPLLTAPRTAPWDPGVSISPLLDRPSYHRECHHHHPITIW